MCNKRENRQGWKVDDAPESRNSVLIRVTNVSSVACLREHRLRKLGWGGVGDGVGTCDLGGRVVGDESPLQRIASEQFESNE